MAILCVDNDQEFLCGMVRRITAAGLKVDSAESYESALELFVRDRFHYDVVVTDLDLQGGNERDGEYLAQALIELRETRGYCATPEIICLTGARSKIDAHLRNQLQERGCQYVLKGTDQYFLEIQAALLRIHAAKGRGPLLLFVHHPSINYQWDDRRSWECSVGEDVESVYILHSGRRIKVKIAPAPRRVLDFLARHAWRRAYTAEEVANSMAMSHFYNYWSPESSYSRDSVKNNVRRIRVALDTAFRSGSLPFTSGNVLETELNEEHAEPYFDRQQEVTRRTFTACDSDLLISPTNKTEGYRFRAHPLVEHLP